MGVRHITKSEVAECFEHACFSEQHPTITLGINSTIAEIAEAVGRDPYDLLRELLYSLGVE